LQQEIDEKDDELNKLLAVKFELGKENTSLRNELEKIKMEKLEL
jgi:hypothetical protein